MKFPSAEATSTKEKEGLNSLYPFLIAQFLLEYSNSSDGLTAVSSTVTERPNISIQFTKYYIY